MAPCQDFSDIRVVDFSQDMAGPYCGHLLAHYGADVVKVEPPTGDRLSPITRALRTNPAGGAVSCSALRFANAFPSSFAHRVKLG